MAEDGVGTSPHVFVVDSQANYITMPDEKKSWQARPGQKFLLLLGVLAATALIIQGYLIYNLYQKTEVSPLSVCNMSVFKRVIERNFLLRISLLRCYVTLRHISLS